MLEVAARTGLLVPNVAYVTTFRHPGNTHTILRYFSCMRGPSALSTNLTVTWGLLGGGFSSAFEAFVKSKQQMKYQESTLRWNPDNAKLSEILSTGMKAMNELPVNGKATTTTCCLCYIINLIRLQSFHATKETSEWEASSLLLDAATCGFTQGIPQAVPGICRAQNRVKAALAKKNKACCWRH